MSDLVGNPEDRFSRVEAHISLTCYPDEKQELTYYKFRYSDVVLYRTALEIGVVFVARTLTDV